MSFPTPGDHPDPGLEPAFPASPALAGGFFTTSTTWEAQLVIIPNFTEEKIEAPFGSRRWDVSLSDISASSFLPGHAESEVLNPAVSVS